MTRPNDNKWIEIFRDLSDGSYLISMDSSSEYIRVKSIAPSSSSTNLENFTACCLSSRYFPKRDIQFVCGANALLGLLSIPHKLVSTGTNGTNGNTFIVITDVKFIRINGTNNIPDRPDDESVAEVKKFLTSGCFYYASIIASDKHLINGYYDLTRNLAQFHKNSPPQRNFYWNRGWVLPLIRSGINQRSWCAPIICGYVSCQTLSISHNCTLSFWLISRMSCRNVGTRFNSRGSNDLGYSANFVETEQILIKTVDTYTQSKMIDECGYVLIRGSVPLHWAQSSLQVGGHRITMTRSPILSLSSFLLHFKRLSLKYGDIFILNLSSSRQDEGVLTNHYRDAFNQMLHEKSSGSFDSSHMHFAHFDYHEHMKSVKNISIEAFVINYLLKHRDGQAIWPFVTSHGYWHFRTTSDVNHHRQIVECICEQKGAIRFNCIDCLDRTNAVQSWIANSVLFAIQTRAIGMENLNSIIQDNVRAAQMNAWAENGDAISRIYTGTGALTGKSRAHDVTRSLARALQNNLYDVSKTAVMEVLVNSYNRTNGFTHFLCTHLSPQLLFGDEYVLKHFMKNIDNSCLDKDSSSISTPRKLRIGIYTWNINGDKDQATKTNKDDRTGMTATLSSWLLDGPEQLIEQNISSKSVGGKANFERVTGFVSEKYTKSEPDIYAIGFQEICDITASSIVKASEENMERWYDMISSMLNKDGENRYINVSRDQLVGVCLILFAKRSLAPHIRFINTAKIKTGFMNSAGNKGCVAVRFGIFNTTLCFICAHFEAGQNQVSERNDDYDSIVSKLSNRFKTNLLSHDYVFFFGDFNYRINLSRAQVLDYIERNRYAELLSADQLIEQRLSNRVFRGFEEGPVMFNPTYKYDYHCQIYDSSEKARIPSWCDRIMWKQNRPFQTFLTNPATGKSSGDERLTGADLLYYARTELMTSDHRPVAALLDVRALEVNANHIVEAYKRLRSHSFASCHVRISSDNSTNQLGGRLRHERDIYTGQLKDSFCVSTGDRSELHLFFNDPEQANFVAHLKGGCTLERPELKSLTMEFELMFDSVESVDKGSGVVVDDVAVYDDDDEISRVNLESMLIDHNPKPSSESFGNSLSANSRGDLIEFSDHRSPDASDQRKDDVASTGEPSSLIDELLSIDWTVPKTYDR